MLDLLTKELQSKKALIGELPSVFASLSNVISNSTIPDRMKAVIILSEISTYTSQFRRNLWHWDGFELPVNSIGIVVAGSGIGKDSGVKAVRRAFKTSYELIDNKRKAIAKANAINEARESGEDNYDQWEVYKPYYNEPAPIYIAPTTPQGFIQHINDLSDLPMGSGTTYAGEMGDELATNGNMLEIIKTIAETYDTGDKEMVYTKGKDFRSKEIKSMPVSALLVGSPNYIVYDEGVKKKFLIAFGSKLARRSFFCYVPETIEPPTYASVMQMIEAEEAATFQATQFKEEISRELIQITQHNLQKATELLQIDKEVFYLFSTYKRYNEEYSKTINPSYPLSTLVRQHLQWKALKLAGAFAIMKCQDSVTETDYIEAINVCELLDKDMSAFEAELIKEPYEVFADYMSSMSVNGEFSIGLHELRKMKYIPMSGNPAQKMKDLVHLAAAYDTDAVYSVKDDHIHYQAIIKTDTLNISFREIDNSEIFNVIANKGSKAQLTAAKERVSYEVAKGLTTGETTFEDLGTMLTADYAYSPFVFTDGIRGRDNVIGGTKWLVLDIDTSEITASEAHFMLQDLNHHIALSSDKDNEFKFRVILELDSIVELEPNIWRHFITAVANDLSIQADILAQSAIYYSYSGREVLSITDAEPLAVRDYIMQANDRASESTPVTQKSLTQAQKDALINDEFTTFNNAFEAPAGSGSREMIKAAYYARDLGMAKEDIINLVNRINDYWTHPLSEERMANTIVNQILRF